MYYGPSGVLGRHFTRQVVVALVVVVVLMLLLDALASLKTMLD